MFHAPPSGQKQIGHRRAASIYIFCFGAFDENFLTYPHIEQDSHLWKHQNQTRFWGGTLLSLESILDTPLGLVVSR